MAEALESLDEREHFGARDVILLHDIDIAAAAAMMMMMMMMMAPRCR